MNFILFYRMDWTDANPLKTGICGAALVVLAMCVMHGWGVL